MFYALKKSIIQAGLDYRKKHHPFREEDCELFEIQPNDPHEVNNSFFLGAHLTSGEDLTLRLGLRNGGSSELFVLYRHQGKLFYMEQDHYPTDECPVQVRCEQVGQRWRYTMQGFLRDAEGRRYATDMDVLFTATLPIYDFVQGPDRHEGMTSAIARAPWNRAFRQALSSSSQKHYEQTGRIGGYISIDGQRRELDWPAVRDRAIGKRVWNFMDHHIWLNCTTDQGEALTFSVVSYPIMKHLFTGYTNIGRSVNVTLADYALGEYDHCNGLGSDRIKVMPRWSDGRTMWIEACRDSNVLCTFDGGDYIFQEGLGDFRINGVQARGNIEYGYNRDHSRWLNI